MTPKRLDLALDLRDARNLTARADAVGRALTRASRTANPSDRRSSLDSATWHTGRMIAEAERFHRRLVRRHAATTTTREPRV